MGTPAAVGAAPRQMGGLRLILAAFIAAGGLGWAFYAALGLLGQPPLPSGGLLSTAPSAAPPAGSAPDGMDGMRR